KRCTTVSKRLRVSLEFTLIFAILIGLSSAFAQTQPGRSESIVIFAPHRDDEVIGCAGINAGARAWSVGEGGYDNQRGWFSRCGGRRHPQAGGSARSK